ncbi:MAG: beta-lactamase family protein [Bacteroidetes bacterium]|nr:beta-lactamase family protein [Bacteroidota bacterium]
MERSVILFILFFSFLNTRSQDGEDVLLTLSLDSVFSKIKENEPGANIYIQKGHRLMYSKSFGLTNLKTKAKFDENTLINISSITKTFIAYSILILQKQGQLSIEDSISKFFPGINNKEELNKLKIKHLLSHTSGLPVVRTSKLSFTDFIDKPEFEPGSNYRDSEQDYNILAVIIEYVGKGDWQTFIQQNIFSPTGMLNAKFVNENNTDDEITGAYRKEKNIYKIVKHHICNEKLPACNSIWTSIGNLRKYAYAIKECVFLDCETLKPAMKIYKPENWRALRIPTQGFAWTIHEEKNKDTFMECEGLSPGYKCQIVMYPKQDILVIWLSNNDVSYSNVILQKLIQRKYIK